MLRREVVDVSSYNGWQRAGHAGPEDHPRTMGSQALSLRD